MKKKYLKLISTDSIGYFGNPMQFITLYKTYFDDHTFDGVEAIAVKNLSRLNNLIFKLDKNNIKVLSLHGRTGGENQLPFFYRLTMTVVNKMLLNSRQILSNFSRLGILFHTPNSQIKSVEEEILKFRPKNLFLENHRTGKQGIEETIKQVTYYRKKGINAYGLIDIYHYAYNFKTDYLKKHWPRIIKELKNYFLIKDENNTKIFNSVHFPIGTRISDSLPIEEMTDKMLRLFAKEITPLIDRFIIENQVKNFGLVYSTKTRIEKIKKRNQINILRLKKTGLL